MMNGESSTLFTVGDDDDVEDDFDDAPFKSTNLADSGLVMGGNAGSSDLFGNSPLDLNNASPSNGNGVVSMESKEPSTVTFPTENPGTSTTQAEPNVENANSVQDPLSDLNAGMGDLIVDNTNFSGNPTAATPGPQPGQTHQQISVSPAPSHFYRNHNDQYAAANRMNSNIDSTNINPPMTEQPTYNQHANQYSTSYSYSTPGAPMPSIGSNIPNQPPSYPPPHQPSIASSFSTFTSSLKSTFTTSNIPTPSFPSSLMPNMGSAPSTHSRPNSVSNQYAYTENPRSMSNSIPAKVATPKITANYKNINVSHPRFFANSNLFSKSSGGYWMYQVTTTFSDDTKVQVHRRFSHFVALEDRLKEFCPGAIMPPRPDKKNSLDEEGLLLQTAEFAKIRANELQIYLQSLSKHPHASTSPPLQFFLTIPDIGSLWPDVSHSTMTRLSAIGSKAVVQLGEKTSKVTEKYDSLHLEDDAEMVALGNSEDLRLQAVEKHIPSVSLLIKEVMVEYANLQMALGMEASKCSKNIKVLDNDLAAPLQILSSSVLRDGRQSKRLSIQLSSHFNPYWKEYKQIENVRSAFSDRKNALLKKHRAKYRADYNAARLLRDQTSLLTLGKMEELKRLEDDAQRSDEFVNVCEEGAKEVGDVLKEEVMRLSKLRRREYLESLKGMATDWKDCCTERAKLWEGAKKLMEEK